MSHTSEEVAETITMSMVRCKAAWILTVAIGLPLASAFSGCSSLSSAVRLRGHFISSAGRKGGRGLRGGRLGLPLLMAMAEGSGSLSRKDRQKMKKKDKEEKRALRKQYSEMTNTLVDNLMDDVSF